MRLSFNVSFLPSSCLFGVSSETYLKIIHSILRGRPQTETNFDSDCCLLNSMYCSIYVFVFFCSFVWFVFLSWTNCGANSAFITIFFIKNMNDE